MSISDRIDILHPLQAILVLNAPMSTTPVRVSRTASERPRGETEELSLSRRLLEPSTSLLTGVSNIACSEGSLLETRVEHVSFLFWLPIFVILLSPLPESFPRLGCHVARSRDTQRCYRYCVYTAAERPH